jgi:hypothetical protein
MSVVLGVQDRFRTLEEIDPYLQEKAKEVSEA